MITNLQSADSSYRYQSVVFSHGWSDLVPFYLQTRNGTLIVVLSSERKKPCRINVRSRARGISVEHDRELSQGQVQTLRWMFRLDDDLRDFYDMAHRNGKPWIENLKMGRILRSPSIVEDLLKLILTTNCSWSMTRKMTDQISSLLTTPVAQKLYSFPTLKDLEGVEEEFFRDQIRAGYRSPYLVRTVQMILQGEVDPASWGKAQYSIERIKKELKAIPGAGKYVSDNMLRLLGHYSYLGLDRWALGILQKKWRLRKVPTEKEVGEKYKRFGDFAGLALWCDLTKDWFVKGDFESWIRLKSFQA